MQKKESKIKKKIGDNPKYAVFFDTSVLFSSNYPISQEVARLIDTFSKDKRVSITFVLPELVREEFKNGYLEELKTNLKSYSDRISSVEKLWDEKIDRFTLSDKDILEKAEKILARYKFQILKTPINKIDWQKALDLAISHKAPFNVKDQGFKDFVILESLVFGDKRKFSGNKIVFLFKDKRMQERIDDLRREGKLKRVEIYDSVEQFESTLGLELENLDKKRIEKISDEAWKLFYNTQSPEKSLYKKWDIEGQIKNKFSSDITQIPGGNLTYVLAGGESRDIRQDFDVQDRPIFREKKGNFYFWDSKVLFKKYRAGTILSNTLVRIEFIVKWKVKLTRDNNLKESSLISIEKGNETTNPLYIPYPTSFVGTPSGSIRPSSFISATAENFGSVNVGGVGYKPTIVGVNDTDELGLDIGTISPEEDYER